MYPHGTGANRCHGLTSQQSSEAAANEDDDAGRVAGPVVITVFCTYVDVNSELRRFSQQNCVHYNSYWHIASSLTFDQVCG